MNPIRIYLIYLDYYTNITTFNMDIKMDTINIICIVKDNFCTEAEDGQKVFELVSKSLKGNQNVLLSFLNVEMLTVAFINTAIGQLYKSFSEDTLKRQLTVTDLSDSGVVLLKRVVDTAKIYYKNPGAMEQSINDILGE